MSEKPASPFVGLDKALLRTTRSVQPLAAEPPTAPTPATADLATPTPPKRARRANTSVDPTASTDASQHASVRASVPQREHARRRDEINPLLIDGIRKIVKSPGKEVSFVRLTAAEKGRLADIVYTYKRQGVKTSENEINRIAVNYMLADYETHGEASVLAQVIAALLA